MPGISAALSVSPENRGLKLARASVRVVALAALSVSPENRGLKLGFFDEFFSGHLL